MSPDQKILLEFCKPPGGALVVNDRVSIQTPAFRTFTAAETKIYREIRESADEVEKLTERKRLTNILKMVAYQIEGILVELLRPHYARTEEEGRTLIQTALRSSASIEPTEKELHVNLAPSSSPHRSKAIAMVCDTLNKTETVFPGTNMRIIFLVSEPDI